MATGYTIEIGYISGYSFRGDTQEAWNLLAGAASVIARHPHLIEEEALRFGAPKVCPCGCGATLREHAEIYQKEFIIEGGPLLIDYEKKVVFQSASGQREMKEHVRRAFIRCVMYEMHKLGIEISVIVS